jgi:purine-binding chemotaxis protein CheW
LQTLLWKKKVIILLKRKGEFMDYASVESEHGQAAEGRRQYVAFSLNGEEYAVDSGNVVEILELSTVTNVPHLPDFFKGVINLRGSIIPVIDMKLKLGMAFAGYKKHTCVIVTEFSKGVMGLIVDSVSDVLHLPEEAISAVPSFGPGIRTEFIKSMGRVMDRLLMILDIERALAGEEILLTSRSIGGVS